MGSKDIASIGLKAWRAASVLADDKPALAAAKEVVRENPNDLEATLNFGQKR